MEEVINEFIAEQNNRLQQKTFLDYNIVMEIFQVYLKKYAEWDLTDEENEDLHMSEEPDVLSFVAPENLTAPILADFFEFFLIRKVMSDESFMKQAIKVVKKFTKWLSEQDYITKTCYRELKGYFTDNNRAARLPNAEKLVGLFYQFIDHSPDRNYVEEEEGFFEVVQIEGNQIWLENITE